MDQCRISPISEVKHGTGFLLVPRCSIPWGVVVILALQSERSDPGCSLRLPELLRCAGMMEIIRRIAIAANNKC
jgi:hypothetical protein